MLPERLKEQRLLHKLTQQQVADTIGITRPAYTAYESGNRQPDYELLKQLAALFRVSTDYLLGKTDKPNYYSLSNKEKLDIGDQAQRIIDGLDSNTDVNFFGEPMTEEQKQSMRDIIATGLLINKEKAKKKFTPKKYRDTGTDGD